MTFGDLVNGQAPAVPSALFTPTHVFTTSITVTFWYSIYVGTITIYQYAGAYQRKFVDLYPSGNYSERFQWRKYELCVPEGTYQLAFIGDVEAKQFTAIDDVMIDSGIPCNFPVTSGKYIENSLK